ncbi:hypothetical protein [Palaeococcus sp. (in: euryarchaeotes)]
MGKLGAMGMFGAFGAMAVVMFLIMIAVDAVFLWFGAKFAKIEDATFGKAFIAALAAILGRLIPFIGGLIAFLWIIKTVFNTDWGKAVITWLFAIVIAIVIAIIMAVAVGISMMAFL